MFIKNKSEMDIIAVLLDAAKSDGGVSQASLMCKAELSFAMMREYLRILVDTELIEEKIVEGNQQVNVYRTTGKGMDYLGAYELLTTDIKTRR